MAKEFAKSFYHSAAWEKVRELALIRDGGLCCRCYRPAYIVHHKIELTPNNINDPTITLDINNLESLCKKCHDAEHDMCVSKNNVDGVRFDENGDVVIINDVMRDINEYS